MLLKRHSFEKRIDITSHRDWLKGCVGHQIILLNPVNKKTPLIPNNILDKWTWPRMASREPGSNPPVLASNTRKWDAEGVVVSASALSDTSLFPSLLLSSRLGFVPSLSSANHISSVIEPCMSSES